MLRGQKGSAAEAQFCCLQCVSEEGGLERRVMRFLFWKGLFWVNEGHMDIIVGNVVEKKIQGENY